MLGRGVGQGAMTGLPGGAGLWDEQEITAGLSLHCSRVSRSAGPVVWMDSDSKGLNISAGEFFTFFWEWTYWS